MAELSDKRKRLRGRHNIAVRRYGRDDPRVLAIQQEMKFAKLEERILQELPHLKPEERERLAQIVEAAPTAEFNL
jgi:hypothetical protein